MEQGVQSSRKAVFVVTIGLMFLLFFSRLVQLQVLYQDVYGKKSEENSIRPIDRDPIRGLIFDRSGKLLVDNRPSYTVTLTPAEVHMSTIPYLANILQLDTAFIKERLKKGKQYNRFAPIKLKRDIDFRTLSIIEENREKLPGIDYQAESKRFYPTKAKGTHLFGYTKEISDQQLAEMGAEYRPGDNIGATGLEAAYEVYLRGKKGYEFITVNAKGQMLGAYNDGKNDIPVKEGDDLYLAIDEGVQALAESLLADKRGAVVAVDPSDGGVIALVSKPDYNLTVFGGVTPQEMWNQLNTDSTRPLFNRATMTRYPPGSTFKMVLAAAALQEGIINENWRIQCPGSFRFGTRVFKDHIVHGSTNVVESIQRSCNVFYYQLMLKTGFERWTHYGEEFGFGSQTGIDILEETSGLLPSKEYFDRIYGKGRWTQGYLVSLAIGQGEVGVSPLQMACYAAALGNKGYWRTPHVVEKIRDRNTGQVEEVQTETRRIELNEYIWDLIHKGMYRAVNEPGGTALTARVPGVAVAGKTGTAQNPHGKDHAWFIGFAPVDNPKIAICVLVENAGFGGVISAPIASMCIEQYLYHGLIRDRSGQVITAAKDLQLPVPQNPLQE
ncbi:MAG: penicillin-binding protein 2 [Ignavibacteria bacterium]|nr:penicillin-binding protein 2 [Ignavibacteria bacterium]